MAKKIGRRGRGKRLAMTNVIGNDRQPTKYTKLHFKCCQLEHKTVIMQEMNHFRLDRAMYYCVNGFLHFSCLRRRHFLAVAYRHEQKTWKNTPTQTLPSVLW